MTALVIKIIITLCSPMSMMYWPGGVMLESGTSRLLRIIMAPMPPSNSMARMVNRYCKPITLWSRLSRKYRPRPRSGSDSVMGVTGAPVMRASG